MDKDPSSITLEMSADEAYALLMLVDSGIANLARHPLTFEKTGLGTVKRAAPAINALRLKARENHERGLNPPPLEWTDGESKPPRDFHLMKV